MSKTKDILSTIFLYIVSIIFFIIAQNMKGDAGLFPKLLSGLIFILNSIQLFFIIVKNTLSSKSKEDLSIKKLIIIMLLCSLYVLLLKYLGFIISSILFLISSVFLLEVENKKLGIFIGICTVIVIYICFGIFLRVQIPVGIFGV